VSLVELAKSRNVCVEGPMFNFITPRTVAIASAPGFFLLARHRFSSLCETSNETVSNPLAGAKLLTAENKLVDATFGPNTHVLLYFSASWCPPCRKFTPKLKAFYEMANKSKKRVEVVFISCDETEDEALAYMRESHGDWLMAPYKAAKHSNVKDGDLRLALKKRYGAS